MNPNSLFGRLTRQWQQLSAQPAAAHFDLLIVAVLALDATVTVWLGLNRGPIGVTLALLLALALPGYALCCALFPDQALDKVERIALTFGLSLGIVAIGGLVLNLTPWGLHATSWSALLGFITIEGCIVALFRRESLYRVSGVPLRAPRVSLSGVWVYGLVLLLLVVAQGVAQDAAAQQESSAGFTQLWVAPSSSGERDSVQVGVRNQEGHTIEYWLRIEFGPNTVAQSALTLENGQQWLGLTPLPPDLPSGAPVSAYLYRADAPDLVYRHVQLRMGARPVNNSQDKINLR